MARKARTRRMLHGRVDTPIPKALNRPPLSSPSAPTGGNTAAIASLIARSASRGTRPTDTRPTEART